MRRLLFFQVCILITFIDEGVTSNDRLAEVETTVDGKFIITYPSGDKKDEKNNATEQDFSGHHHQSSSPSSSFNFAQTRSSNLKEEKKPVMPNPGPLSSYGHPSNRYKNNIPIDRDISSSSVPQKNPEPIKAIDTPTNDSDPDPFSSQRRIKPLVVPDAYSAAPIFAAPESSSSLQTNQKISVIENEPLLPDTVSSSKSNFEFLPSHTILPKPLDTADSVHVILPSSVAKKSEENETSEELLNKETFNNEGSDYDNDVFEDARLKDDATLAGTFFRPTVVHPQKSKKLSRPRQFAAAPTTIDNEEDEEAEDTEIIPETAFPLPSCYRTAGGFLCCNRFLEELIYRSNTVVQNKQLSGCNVHAFASTLQTAAEKMFKTTFEIIIGTGDFASKTRFKDNLICKTVSDKKVILIYGTPEPYSLTEPNTPLAFN